MNLYLFTHRFDDKSEVMEVLTLEELKANPYIISNHLDRFFQCLIVADSEIDAEVIANNMKYSWMRSWGMIPENISNN